ncbi:MAG: LCP family protein [Cyanobacteria bacterium P01_C01_bin.72]
MSISISFSLTCTLLEIACYDLLLKGAEYYELRTETKIICMNHKRGRNSKQLSWHEKRHKIARPKTSVSLADLLQAAQVNQDSPGSHQINPLPQPLPSRWRYSCWSYFNRGLFWGGLVSLTAIFSAIGGMALTKIDLVEQQIANQLSGNYSRLLPETYADLNTPQQILLVEVEPKPDSLSGFSLSAVGKSKTILLLKIEPELNSAEVINIPLDTQVEVAGVGMVTIEDAYRIGGMDFLSRTVNQLSEDITVERYLQTTPEVWQQLKDSGRITLKKCDSRIRDCGDPIEQLARQSTAFETIRQRFNIPAYFSRFQTAIAKVESELDTNISESEIISVAHFIKELEPDRLKVDLWAEYDSSRNSEGQDLATKSSFKRHNEPLDTPLIEESTLAKDNPFWDQPVAVQNTTNNPELGQRVVDYLRHRNFRDVYLVNHMPLKLKQTKIVTNYRKVETANYLKNILGFGNLESSSAQPKQELILQLGKDAVDLPINYRSD